LDFLFSLKKKKNYFISTLIVRGWPGARGAVGGGGGGGGGESAGA